MDIKFLGYGGAFDFRYGNSSAVLKWNGKNILIDCGFLVYPMLCEAGVEMDIDYVLITHMHNDHTGSLSNYLLHYKLQGGNRMKILYPDERMKKLLTSYLEFSLQLTTKYVEFVELSEIKGADFIDTYGKHVPGMQTYAYIFKNAEETLIYSGDLGDAKALFDELEKKGIESGTVFHDVYFQEGLKVHAYYKSLYPYMKKFNITGYHHDPTQKPADCRIELVADKPEHLFDFKFPMKLSRGN